MIRKGFTTSELIIVLGIISVLAIILVPQLQSASPNRELSMFKKVYYNTERIVNEMINDDNMYPEPTNGEGLYFANTEEIMYNGDRYSGTEKFARIFASKLNLSTPVTCTISNCTFTSNDGVVWTLPKTNFSSNTSQIVSIDVNGDGRPNCFYGGGDTCVEPDRFRIKVYQKGIVEPDGVMEKEYLERRNISKNAKIETFSASSITSASNARFPDNPDCLISVEDSEQEEE